MQDCEYAEGTGVLDFHNGRFCVTPEYPTGTYAYFLATEEGNEGALDPQFPYMMGTTSRETLNKPANDGAAPPPGDGGGGDGDDGNGIIHRGRACPGDTYPHPQCYKCCPIRISRKCMDSIPC